MLSDKDATVNPTFFVIVRHLTRLIRHLAICYSVANIFAVFFGEIAVWDHDEDTAEED